MPRPRATLPLLMFALTLTGWGRPALAKTVSVIYSFTDGADGAIPYYSMATVAGVLYGTTVSGGNQPTTIFSLTTGGVETTLSTLNPFIGAPDGGLTSAGNTLYGVIDDLLFSVNIAGGAPNIIYYFSGTGKLNKGAYPLGDVLPEGAAIVGTTRSGGGPCNCGTVYRAMPSGRVSLLYRFDEQAAPAGGLVKIGSDFYGLSGNSVYHVNTHRAFSVLHYFSNNGIDGTYPVGSLVNVNGVLYGMTYQGGTYNEGTVFSITTAGAEQILHSFGAAGDGTSPYDGLTYSGGALYGTTYSGGAYNSGTVFEITPSGTFTILHSFKINSADGAFPASRPVSIGSTIYGTTLVGGDNGYGTVYAVTP